MLKKYFFDAFLLFYNFTNPHISKNKTPFVRIATRMDGVIKNAKEYFVVEIFVSLQKFIH